MTRGGVVLIAMLSLFTASEADCGGAGAYNNRPESDEVFSVSQVPSSAFIARAPMLQGVVLGNFEWIYVLEPSAIVAAIIGALAILACHWPYGQSRPRSRLAKNMTRNLNSYPFTERAEAATPKELGAIPHNERINDSSIPNDKC